VLSLGSGDQVGGSPQQRLRFAAMEGELDTPGSLVSELAEAIGWPLPAFK
jgi:hypothetical protein